MNDLDRFHLAGDVVDRVPMLQRTGAHFQQLLRNKLVDHKQYVRGNMATTCPRSRTGSGPTSLRS